MEAGKCKICNVSQQAWNPDKLMVQMKFKAVYWRTPSCSWKLIFLFIQAFCWLDETGHIMESNLLYSEFTNLNVNILKRPPSWHIKLTSHVAKS